MILRYLATLLLHSFPCRMENNSKTELNLDLNPTKVYHWTLIIVGSLVFLYSAIKFPYEKLGTQLIFISIITLLLGSRVAIDFKVFKSNISVADVFIYLIAILYGGETATFLVTIEAYITSSKFTKRVEYRAFNAGTLATSIFCSSKISYYFFGQLSDLIQNGITPTLFLAVVTMIVSHYFINTIVIAVSTAFRSEKPIIETWLEYYVWMFIPFLASGSVALVAANAVKTSGFYAFLIILPIIGIIYFGYFSQQGKLQAITEKAKQAEDHLIEIQEREERFRSAFSNAPIGMALISCEGDWLQVNESFCKIFDYSEEEILSKKIQDVISSESMFDFLNNVGKVIQGKQEVFQAELSYFNKNKELVWTQTSISLLNDTQNIRLICQIQDITARRIAEEKLRYDAFNDSLTGLANRNSLMLAINSAISKAKEKSSEGFLLLFVDVDRFKLVNDTAGHSVGDKLLVAIAQRLRKCVDENTLIARFGGDEFLILLEEELDKNSIENLVREIQNQIGISFLIAGHEINLTASIGIVSFDNEHQTAEDMLRDADTALQIAKKYKNSQYEIFDQNMREKVQIQMRLENDLHKAVEKNEFYLVYQPILSLSEQMIFGFEALIRWNHSKLGLVSPLEFISLAEENGTIIKIGQFVLEESCRQLQCWNKHFGYELPLTISVNVSAKQLLHRQFFASVVEIIEKYKVNPQNIKLEITESVVVENSDLVISVLKQLRAIGLSLSMDDFGTGYSSLSYLHKLPINTLKIDRSFVNQIENEAESSEIVKTIVLLAKNLNLDVVAEGIETEGQNLELTKMNCNFGQGFLFSKPLNVGEATTYLKNSLDRKNYPIISEVQFDFESVSH